MARGEQPVQIAPIAEQMLLAHFRRAQTVERLGEQLDAFLRRCTGGMSTVQGTQDGAAKSPVASSLFARIDDAGGRLDSALAFLDARIQKLSEIG